MNGQVKERVAKKNNTFTSRTDTSGSVEIKRLLAENQVEFVDLRFTDLRGKEHHVTIPESKVDDNFFKFGKAFDGSSLCGWQDINESDLLLWPDTSTAIMDHFCEAPTLIIRCDIYDPSTQASYICDPRAVARRVEAYIKAIGIAETCN